MTIDLSRFSPMAMQTGLSIDNTTGGITLTMPTNARPRAAVITVFTAPIRFTVTGTAPTATLGHRADIHEQIVLENSAEVTNFKGIREGGTSATIDVTFYG